MFSDPVKNIEQCGIQPGMEIADIGSGSGFYTLGAAKALASTGRVYAIDIQKDLLTRVKNQAAREGLYNVEVIWGDVEKPGGTKLRDASIDLAFLSTILFQLSDKKVAIEEVKRIPKPAGRVMVIDWMDSFSGIGPKPDMVISKNTVMDMFEKEGFHLDREISAGAHHYGMIYKKL